MKFADKVKELRKRKGLSQGELAKLLGVSMRTIASYETGNSYPRRHEFYAKLAEVLDTDVNYLRTEDEVFMESVGVQYGSRGQQQAAKIMEEVSGLFAGGELSPEDELAFIMEIQELYLDAKKKAKRFTPKKFLQQESSSDE